MKNTHSKPVHIYHLFARINHIYSDNSYDYCVSGLVFYCPLTGVLCWMRSGAAVLQFVDSPINIFFLRKIRSSWICKLQTYLPAWVQWTRFQIQKKRRSKRFMVDRRNTYCRATAWKTLKMIRAHRKDREQRNIHHLALSFRRLKPWLTSVDQRTVDYRTTCFMIFMTRNGWMFKLDSNGTPIGVTGSDWWDMEYIFGASRDICISNVTPCKDGSKIALRADTTIGYKIARQVSFFECNGRYVFAPCLDTLKKLQDDLAFHGFADAIRFCQQQIQAQLRPHMPSPNAVKSCLLPEITQESSEKYDVDDIPF